jgi:hypothetical protein
METINKNINKMMIEYEGGKEKQNSNVEKKIYEIPIDHIKAKRQHKIEINGIEIYFPHVPYQSQITYMSKGIIFIK